VVMGEVVPARIDIDALTDFGLRGRGRPSWGGRYPDGAGEPAGDPSPTTWDMGCYMGGPGLLSSVDQKGAGFDWERGGFRRGHSSSPSDSIKWEVHRTHWTGRAWWVDDGAWSACVQVGHVLAAS
jgi:hypothetical protein